MSLGSMTEVMNSCDSAVGDYSVSGASEEENISLQVGCASLGQLAECSLETHISDLFKRNKANETQKHVKDNIQLLVILTTNTGINTDSDPLNT